MVVNDAAGKDEYEEEEEKKRLDLKVVVMLALGRSRPDIVSMKGGAKEMWRREIEAEELTLFVTLGRALDAEHGKLFSIGIGWVEVREGFCSN